VSYVHSSLEYAVGFNNLPFFNSLTNGQLIGGTVYYGDNFSTNATFPYPQDGRLIFQNTNGTFVGDLQMPDNPDPFDPAHISHASISLNLFYNFTP
jgi:hypothetical protein